MNVWTKPGPRPLSLAHRLRHYELPSQTGITRLIINCYLLTIVFKKNIYNVTFSPDYWLLFSLRAGLRWSTSTSARSVAARRESDLTPLHRTPSRRIALLFAARVLKGKPARRLATSRERRFPPKSTERRKGTYEKPMDQSIFFFHFPSPVCRKRASEISLQGTVR